MWINKPTLLGCKENGWINVQYIPTAYILLHSYFIIFWCMYILPIAFISSFCCLATAIMQIHPLWDKYSFIPSYLINNYTLVLLATPLSRPWWCVYGLAACLCKQSEGWRINSKAGGAQKEKAKRNIMNVGGGCLCKPCSIGDMAIKAVQ